MKKLLSFLLTIVCLLCSLISIPTNSAIAEDLTEIAITNVINVSADSLNRIMVYFSTDYNEKLFPNTRTNESNLSLTMNIDGTDFTYAQGKYVVSFGQNLGDVGELGLVFKRESGNSNGNNAAFYPSNYPGLEKNKAHTLTLYKDTVIGGFILADTVTLLIYEDGASGTLIDNPQEVNIQGGIFVNGVFTLNDKIQANENALVSFTPSLTTGMTVDTITVTKANGQTVSLDIQEKQGVYTFVMPAYSLNIVITQKEVFYTLTCGTTTITLSPNQPIGTLPDGTWFVDGLEISAATLYVWTENKVATQEGNVVYFEVDDKTVWKQTYDPIKNGSDVRFPSLPAKDGYTANWEETEFNGGVKIVNAVYTLKKYTVTFMVDDEIYSYLEFTMNTDCISLPVIPYKAGYKIVGWDLTEFPKQDVIATAVYEKIA